MNQCCWSILFLIRKKNNKMMKHRVKNVKESKLHFMSRIKKKQEKKKNKPDSVVFMIWSHLHEEEEETRLRPSGDELSCFSFHTFPCRRTFIILLLLRPFFLLLLLLACRFNLHLQTFSLNCETVFMSRDVSFVWSLQFKDDRSIINQLDSL